MIEDFKDYFKQTLNCGKFEGSSSLSSSGSSWRCTSGVSSYISMTFSSGDGIENKSRKISEFFAS